jgi:hypothetical protein
LSLILNGIPCHILCHFAAPFSLSLHDQFALQKRPLASVDDTDGENNKQGLNFSFDGAN